MLVEQIAPRLRLTVPACVKTVGAEDAEELVQDAIAMAAQMVHNLELREKHVTPGNIAYYIILHLRSGRRSSSGGRRTDVLATSTQLDHNSCVLSIEEEVGYDPELDEPITLGDLLAADQDDPSIAAGRNADWDEFLLGHDYRYGLVLRGIIEGRAAAETAANNGREYVCIYELQKRLAGDVREFMGGDAIADSARPPSWRANVMVDRERASCQAERRKR